MDFRDRIVGYCSSPNPEKGDRPFLDVSSLLLNLLLFDTYILKTHQYSEIAQLIELFDYRGVTKLLKSGALQFDPTRIFAVGIDAHVKGLKPNEQSAKVLFTESDAPTQRPGSYQITVVQIGNEADADSERSLATSKLEGLSKSRQNRLEQVLHSSTSARPSEIHEPATSQTHLELDRTTSDLNDAIGQLLKDGTGAHPDPSLIRLRIHREDETRITVESNLVRGLGLPEQGAHCVIGNALLSLARCNTSLAHMRAYSAVTGMPPDEQRFLDRKLSFLTDFVSPDALVGNYQKVMDLVGLPTIATGVESGSIDMDHFLAIRASQQCVEFREWLRDASPADAVEAANALNSLWRRAVGRVKSTPGRVIRYAVISGLGIAHPPAGIALGALDIFFLDSLLPSSGPSLFLSNDYPSMFLPRQIY